MNVDLQQGAPPTYVPTGKSAVERTEREMSILAEGSPLSGHRVLVVEDEYFLADDIVRALIALGAQAIGPYGDINDATDAVDRDIAIDAAIVDINLRNELVFPLARILRARKVPFVFMTGYDRTSIDAEFQDVPLWGKPLDVKALAGKLTGMIRRA